MLKQLFCFYQIESSFERRVSTSKVTSNSRWSIQDKLGDSTQLLFAAGSVDIRFGCCFRRVFGFRWIFRTIVDVFDRQLVDFRRRRKVEAVVVTHRHAFVGHRDFHSKFRRRSEFRRRRRHRRRRRRFRFRRPSRWFVVGQIAHKRQSSSLTSFGTLNDKFEFQFRRRIEFGDFRRHVVVHWNVVI